VEAADVNVYLTQIKTHWTAVFRAQGDDDEAARARHGLLIRYREAVYRYLQRQLPNDPHAVEKICLDFADGLLRGDVLLLRACRQPGRFRHSLKKVLTQLIDAYYRRKSPPEPADDGADREDAEFRECWRQGLLSQACRVLEKIEKRTGQPYYTVYLVRGSHPALRAAEQAEQASRLLGKPIAVTEYRKLVHRGLDMLGDLIVKEVARSLRPFFGDDVEVDQIEQELNELGLLRPYCQSALARYARRH
jgi:hypothetical protein